MARISETMQREIDAAFAEAGAKGAHGDCVASCRADYEACVAAGHSYCRSHLEACINGCPNGLVGGQEALQALLDRLERIEAAAK
jgi:hypothetical protein